MRYKYRSTEISFLDDTIQIANLCCFGEYYYFESNELIEEAEQISDKQFLEIISEITYVAPESIEPEPTQLDRIESMISKSQEQITKEARDAYTLELINSGII